MRLFSIYFFLSLILSGCQQQTDEHIAMGTLERDTITLSSPVTEQIQSIYINEGDHVSAHQPLMQINAETAQLAVAQAQANLNTARFSLQEKENGARSEDKLAAKAQYEAAKAIEEKARLAYQRTRKLFKTKTVGQAELDNTQTDYRQKRQLSEQSLAQWQRLKNGTRPEVLEQLKAKVAAAESSLKQAQKSLADLTITAPSSGTVVQLPWLEGNRVNMNEPLVRLETVSRPYAQVYVPQTALGKIHEGQTVMIQIDGKPNPYQGTIRYIRRQPAFTPYYALNERDRSRLMYLTKIDIRQAETLPTGITLEVHLP
ncbi:HlyD family secretion protein [Vibrio salinus]|uniref:HlyD family secretion protein n=1 Tax=Vibrio salinus TaxID=2899784 RepID=UPI001E2E54F1|nr:HlyD family efflux transporter periplasmic adaptor subunit [Vibrio salinus]MCE0493723.1 HlyD family efflux transporter periplasmic adaptor subunit [Vibrio salinus]